MTPNQIELYRHYRYITNIMLNHACICDERWCVCQASSFQDALADFKHVADDNTKRLIDEIFHRHDNRYGK